MTSLRQVRSGSVWATVTVTPLVEDRTKEASPVEFRTLTPPRLAVIVPAYDEAERIVPTLHRLAEYFATCGYTWEVTVVSDGSRDKTPQLATDFAKDHPGFKVDHYSPNRGKGYAVRRGVLRANGEWVLFMDADLATPIEEVEKLWAKVDDQTPIAIGSRPLKESRLEIRQPWYREMLGRMFNLAVQMLAVRGIQDTQCGFKLFRMDAGRDVFERLKLDRFAFDIEALMVAHDLGYGIAEVPVVWRHQEGSKVVLMRDGPEMIRQLMKLRLMGKARRLEPRDAD
ncbi:MAG: dolichyl-phosphate beta-glucosyltransferase [Armatimonadota bacterium]